MLFLEKIHVGESVLLCIFLVSVILMISVAKSGHVLREDVAEC